MRKGLVAAACAIACAGGILLAQEGHPLSGTWAGECGGGTDRAHVTIVMNWDGKNVTGTINPGPNAIPIGTVSIDLATWTVRIEADGKDAAGKAAHIIAEGRLEDLGSYHRRIVGTWSQGTSKGDCRLTRD